MKSDMDFMVHGSPTPRNHERGIPGSAKGRPGSGRPPSAKPTISRNPITGEEKPMSRPESRSESRPASRPEGVPVLNLKAFQHDDNKISKPLELIDYPDTGRSGVSTISWGTPCSSARQNMERPSSRTTNKPQSSKSVRPEGVPGLYFGYTDDNKHRAKVQKEKQPTAWDKDPCPDDLPPPSDRYKDMYQQYTDDMKQSYRAKNHSLTEDEVQSEMKAIKKSKPKTYGEIRDEVARESARCDEPEDILDKKWTQKKSYSTQQMMKIMDAEELLEFNKQQKLIETVMIDQLSRAVISDPEQNVRTPVSYDTRRARGSNRYLHDSRVRTSATATENLLSKRVRFGARILTRNGHDALRELTGFYFHIDNTLTIYEFRQFGKSAKALPLIKRGKYKHLTGSRTDEPYTLSDIFSGANLIISTEDQHSLPDSMKKDDHVYFRVTDVDEAAKQELIINDIPVTQRQKSSDTDTHKIITAVQAEVREKIRKRGIKTYTGLGRYYRERDERGDGVMYRFQLEKGLFTFHIDLDPELLDAIFEALDVDERGELDYSVYMREVLGQMNEYRKSKVRKAFKKLDSSKSGRVTVTDVRKYFNSKFRPPPQAAGVVPGVNPVQAFLEAVTASSRQENVSYVEFEEYYEGLSLAIEEDQDFINILHNTWNI
uniref:Calcyphosin-2-like isoform X2 n=1 Tax=Crassostrea virginica TaxID=6565 RepID=A0A8B8AJN2_CRAVI|nr:calcyphosin-2-like isoform X2 [Crassostrea virginica]